MFNFNNTDIYGMPCGKRSAHLRNVGTNLEFRFTSPANIERAVKKYNEQRAAELNVTKKGHKLSMPRFCKVRRTGHDVMTMVTSRDIDVVTQLSMQQQLGGQLNIEDNELEQEDSNVQLHLNYEQLKQLKQQEYLRQLRELEKREMKKMRHKLELQEKKKDEEYQQTQKQNQKQKRSHHHHKAKKQPKERYDDLPDLPADLMQVIRRLGPRLCGGAETEEIAPENYHLTKQQSRVRDALVKVSGSSIADLAYKCVKAFHREMCAEIDQLNPKDVEQAQLEYMPTSKHFAMQRTSANQRLRTSHSELAVKSYQLECGSGLPLLPLRPNAVKISELESLAAQLFKPTLRIEEKVPTRLPQQKGSEIQEAFHESHPQPEPAFAEISHPALMSQALFVNVCNPLTSGMAAMRFMEFNSTVEPESASPFFLEDSDLDAEYASRENYLNYCGNRPSCSNSDEDTESEQRACFVEMERRPHRISLLRSLKPIRYTSQPSEETIMVPNQQRVCGCRKHQQAEKTTERTMTPRNVKPVKIKSPRATEHKATKTNKSNKLVKKVNKTTAASKHAKDDKTPRPAECPQKHKRGRRSTKTSDNKKSQASQQTKHRASDVPKPTKDKCTSIDVGRARQPGGREVVIPQPLPLPPSPPPPQPASPAALMRRQRKSRMRPVVCSKSIENLKFEKQTIYNKLFILHERIICALDRLQTSLLRVQAPHGNAGDHTRRNRSAFEFCVHFSRNFLYPLQSMIESVRHTPVAAFNSAISNEACQRVVTVYSLMRQALAACQRKLGYFLLETVPQKVCACIEMIYTMTSVCLDKGVLDSQDPNVESLQNRCSKVICFVEDMQEERFQLARKANRLQQTQRRWQQRSANIRSNRSHQHYPTQRVRCHDQYDLKMYLNDLKMYEPRLVPKERPKTSRRRRSRRSKKMQRQAASGQLASSVREQNSEDQLQRMPHNVPTQIECISEPNLDQESSMLNLSELEQKPSLTLIAKHLAKASNYEMPHNGKNQEQLGSAENQMSTKNTKEHKEHLRQFNMRIARIMAELEDPNTDMGDANRSLVEALLRIIISKKTKNNNTALEIKH